MDDLRLRKRIPRDAIEPLPAIASGGPSRLVATATAKPLELILDSEPS
jgi:hypothetical protein